MATVTLNDDALAVNSDTHPLRVHGLAFSQTQPTPSVTSIPDDDLLMQPLDTFATGGITQRTVTVAELEQAAELLRRQNPANIRQRQLVAEVIAAHAEQRLQFTWNTGMLEVVSWSSDGLIHHVNPISGCTECDDSIDCIHAVLHQLISIRERGMTVLIRTVRYGGYHYDLVGV